MLSFVNNSSNGYKLMKNMEQRAC